MSEFAKDKDVGDLISREAAIDAPEKLIKDCNPDHFIGHQKFIWFMDNVEIGSFGNWQFANGFNMGLTAAEVAIAKLPSAQPEQKWIPCSERMPEEADGKVLICMPDKWPYNGKEQFHNAKHDKRVETACYSQHNDRWYFEGGAISEDRPVAWMPLPEPYKEGADDKKG